MTNYDKLSKEVFPDEEGLGRPQQWQSQRDPNAMDIDVAIMVKEVRTDGTKE